MSTEVNRLSFLEWLVTAGLAPLTHRKASIYGALYPRSIHAKRTRSEDRLREMASRERSSSSAARLLVVRKVPIEQVDMAFWSVLLSRIGRTTGGARWEKGQYLGERERHEECVSLQDRPSRHLPEP